MVLAVAAGSVVSIGVICGLPVLDRSVRTLVALSGIVVGGTMTATVLTGRRLREGLLRRRDEVEAWLALGAPPRRAVAPGAAAEALVPAGPFTMGTDTEPWALDNERPAHTVELPAYWFDTAPVTNGQYAAFVEAGGYDDPR